MPAEVLKRKVHVGQVRVRVVLEMDIPLRKDYRKILNKRVVDMANSFHRIGEEVVLVTTEELERKP